MKKIILFIICLLFGLMFINAGLNKFFNYMPMPEDIPESTMKLFNAFMEIKWLMPLVGAIEVIGGVLFILPRTRALGAIVILPVMVGILLNSIVNDPSSLIMTSVLMLINIWVIVENREKYALLVS